MKLKSNSSVINVSTWSGDKGSKVFTYRMSRSVGILARSNFVLLSKLVACSAMKMLNLKI